MKDYKARPDLLSERKLLITGAGDGIGREVALACARHGALVILLGRTQEKLEKVYDQIEKEHPGGGRAVIHPLDLQNATEEDYGELAGSISEQFGCLDGLLHNAGVLGQRNPLQYYSTAVWSQVMQVNVNAQFLLTRALLPALQASSDGRILFTSSGVGREGRAYWGAYAVSKFATEGLMQVLAAELRDTSQVRVNSIDPGATRTDMRKAAYPAEDPSVLPAPADLLPAYLYLLGPDSAEEHGQAFDARDFFQQP